MSAPSRPPTAPQGPPPTGPLPAEVPLADLPLAELRARRAALHEEAGRTHRWERLLRARADLATDAAAPVEQLTGLARSAALRALVDRAAAGDLATALREVAVLRRELRAYSEHVQRCLAASTAELVARYATDPAQCLPGQRTAPD